jgi:peptide deformylase
LRAAAWEAEEGCLSLPDVFADITRSERITVCARDLDGEAMTIDADGWFARVLLHEIDHLDGVLFIDRLGRLQRARLRGQLNRLARLTREGMEGLG